MTSWSSGYVTDIDYFPGFYVEQSPLRCQFGLLSQGLAQRDGMYRAGRNEKPACLELGFGYGVTLATHAATCPGTYWGADFNPTHAAFAQDLASAAGSDLTVVDDSFEELLERDDLPQFDMIVAHGVWSWISPENQRAILELVRRHLKPRGVLNISYNCEPGWTQVAPLQRLMALMAGDGATTRTIAERTETAIDFVRRLRDSGAAYFAANPALLQHVNDFDSHQQRYLIHEYFNENWKPVLFADTARQLREAKVEFAASARLVDYVTIINLTEGMHNLVGAIADPIVQQTVYDYCVNRRFRWDLYVRGARRMAPEEQRERLKAMRFALTSLASAVPMSVPAALGEATLKEEIYRPVIDALADNDGAPCSLEELSGRAALKSLDFTQIVEALILLVGAGHAHPVQDDAIIEEARPVCDRLNRHLIADARKRGEVAVLASPVLGTGIAVPRFQQLFLGAIAEGRKTPEEWAETAWEALRAQDQNVIKEGKALETPEENLAELRSMAKEFQSDRLGMLETFGVA